MNVYEIHETAAPNRFAHLINVAPAALIVGAGTLTFLVLAELLGERLDLVIGDLGSMCLRLFLVSLTAAGITYFIFRRKEGVFGQTYRENAERKRTGKVLREQADQLTNAQRMGRMGSWIVNLRSGEVTWSEATCELFGISLTEATETLEYFYSFVLDEDRPIYDAAAAAGSPDNPLFEAEYRIRRADGEVRWLYSRGNYQFDDKGDAFRRSGMVMDITDIKAAQEQLEQKMTLLRIAGRAARLGGWTIELPSRELSWSDENCAIHDVPPGYKPTLEEGIASYLPEYRDEVIRCVETCAKDGTPYDFELPIITAKGRQIWVRSIGEAVRDSSGNIIRLQGAFQDITDRRNLEEQLRQSQKLESVGLLAGGIAHDFNNMLTAINGYSDLTLRKLSADDPLRRNLEEIKKAGVRSAELTSQLLAFSRKQIQQTKILNLNEVISEMEKMVRPLIGENIELDTELADDLSNVAADPGQIEQIILNLAVNAKDAMPLGGKLSLGTANVSLNSEYVAQNVGARVGEYVMLTVSDTGTGIDEEHQEHIFEPFFTTKELGKGTGLGLATVYGIVKQSNGHISYKSDVGIGSTFNIYLPRVSAENECEASAGGPVQKTCGTETILIVEDEPLVRDLGAQILISCGYNVLKASGGEEALNIFRNDPHIDLLVTDVMMPNMSGPQLAERVAVLRPGTRLLFMSGYTDDAIFRQGVKKADSNFIQKPFTYDALVQKVRDRLDSAV